MFGASRNHENSDLKGKFARSLRQSWLARAKNSVNMTWGTLFGVPKRLRKAIWELQDSLKGGGGTPIRQQPSEPTPRGDFPLLAGPTPPAQGTRAPKTTFSDIAKYMILQCAFRVFRTFLGIKSGPVEKGLDASSFFQDFFRSSRRGAKNEPPPPPKKGGLVRGRFQSGLPLTSGANPSCSAGCQH